MGVLPRPGWKEGNGGRKAVDLSAPVAISNPNRAATHVNTCHPNLPSSDCVYVPGRALSNPPPPPPLPPARSAIPRRHKHATGSRLDYNRL